MSIHDNHLKSRTTNCTRQPQQQYYATFQQQPSSSIQLHHHFQQQQQQETTTKLTTTSNSYTHSNRIFNRDKSDLKVSSKYDNTNNNDIEYLVRRRSYYCDSLASFVKFVLTLIFCLTSTIGTCNAAMIFSYYIKYYYIYKHRLFF